MKKTFLLFVSTLFCVSQLFSVNYYIRMSTNTSDWSNINADATHVKVDYTAGNNFATTLNAYAANDVVWIAKGTYTIAGTILPKAGMSIIGGFSGSEFATDALSTRATSDLDGNGITEPWEFTNATEITSSITWTVRALAFTTVTSAIVDGLTIRNIAFNSSSNTISGGMPLGITDAAQLILISGDAQSCELKNSIIKDCSLTTTSPSTLTLRGTICAYTGKITSCLIQGNSIQTGTTSKNTYGGGLALYGGGTEGPTSNSPQAIGCVIRGNKSTGASAANSRAGGAIINSANALGLPKLINCLVYNNETNGQGGGIYLGCSAGVTSNPEVLNCTVIKNKAGSLGGGILFNVAAKCNNSVIWSNIQNASTTAASNDMCFNTAYTTTPATNFYIDNLAFGAKGANGSLAYPPLTNTKLLTTGSNASNTDATLGPKFMNPTTAVGVPTDGTTTTAMTTANLKLGVTSPGLDYANNTLLNNLSITTDITGNTRFVNTTADLGAYEGTTAPVVSWSQSDLNVNATDTPVSLTAASSTFTPSSTPAAAVITYTSDNGCVTISGSTMTIVSSGTAHITASQASNSFYAASNSVSKTVTVSKVDQTISLPATGSKTYGDVDYSPATASSGLTVTYQSTNSAVATIDGTTGLIHIVGVGTTTITASQAGNGIYNAAPDVTQTLTVGAATLTLTSPSAANKVYDGTNTAVVSGSLSGLVNSDAVTCTTGTFARINVENNIPVTCILSGLKAGNYTLTQPGITANITAITEPLSGTVSIGNSSLLPGTDLTVASTATLTIDQVGGSTVHNITVESGGKLNTTQPLTVGNLILKSVKDASTFSSKIDASITATSVKLYKTIDDSKWYFMAFPCNVDVAGITKSDGQSVGALGFDWFIKYYDGLKRATDGTSQGTNWVSVTSGTLSANRGYIFGLKTGTAETELLIPLNTTILAAETAKSIGVAANTGTAGATNEGWNLIGQPYLSLYAAQTGSDAPFMIMPNTDGKTYTVTSKALSTLPQITPFAAYFVQASGAGTISFGLTARQGMPASVATNLSDNVALKVTTTSGTDDTYLIMDNDQSTDYQIGNDMVKWIGTGTDKPQVYTQLNGINYAFNALPMTDVTNMPVGVYTKTAGTTTISANATQAPGLSKLLLTDNSTNPATVTDLLTSDYSFTAAAGTDNGRFVLTAQKISTANTIETDTGGPTLLISNSKLIINKLDSKATVRIFDAIGRMVANKSINNNSTEIQLSAKGMYTIQIESGAKNWTKKFVNQ